jgi:hypothetical protein
MNIEKRLKKIEKKLEQLNNFVHEGAVEIRKLKAEVNGGYMIIQPFFSDRPRKKTRIDLALEGNEKLQKQIDTLCDNLGLRIRGKDDMPEFDVQKKLPEQLEEAKATE